MRDIATRALRILGRAGLLILALAAISAAASAQTSAAPSAELAQCSALTAADLATVPDAPTRIDSAKVVAATATMPAYCEVEGYVAPQVGILMRLPVKGWNGKFLQVGCGGFCGVTYFIRDCDPALAKGYACITTDMGHKAAEIGGLEWAYNNPQAVTDFAYRATHVTALAGKAIIASFYGRGPDKSYFKGCSCGGRQALVEAERFPWDFNGIIVGAPGIDYTDFVLTFALRAHFLYDAAGKPLFDSPAIQFLHNAAVSQCDMTDGVKDGIIGDPRACRFAPRDYVCKAGHTPGSTPKCLTAAQVTAAESFYSARHSASGVRLGDRAAMPGAEASYLGMIDTPVMKPSFYEDFFKYMVLNPNPGPAWRFKDFNPDADYKRMGMIQALLKADDADLSRFKQAGGKLIFYHGWGDGGLSPLSSIAFYNKVERTMGGRAATQDFLRLFMVPGMDHCIGGHAAWSIDYLSYLEKWVEQGQAPDAMIGAHYSDNPMAQIAPTDTPQFTRPVYPYPLAARYKGKGDPNSATSFKPVDSESNPAVKAFGNG